MCLPLKDDSNWLDNKVVRSVSELLFLFIIVFFNRPDAMLALFTPSLYNVYMKKIEVFNMYFILVILQMADLIAQNKYMN